MLHQILSALLEDQINKSGTHIVCRKPVGTNNRNAVDTVTHIPMFLHLLSTTWKINFLEHASPILRLSFFFQEIKPRGAYKG